MRMEADRMAGLRIAERDLISERQVVLEERRIRTDNVPSSVARRGDARAAVRPAQALRHARHRLCRRHQEARTSTISRPSTRRFYVPGNAVLIVAGDTTADAVHKLAEQALWPDPEAARSRPGARPTQGGVDLPQRVIRADARVVEPRWSRDWLAPSYRVGETQLRPCAAGAGAPVRRQRDQPAVAGDGHRQASSRSRHRPATARPASASPRSTSASIPRPAAPWRRSRPRSPSR